MSISREEAIEFVSGKLGIKEVCSQDLDLSLLNKIIRALLSEVPFQNIFLYNVPPEKRFPSIEDVINFGLTCHGGVCIHNNWFAAILLKSLGFDLFTIAGMYAATWNSTDDHVMSVVRGLKDPEDPECSETLFLVDVGNGYPTPGAVPLHRLPHNFPLTAGLEIRYDKVGDLIYRMHRAGDPVEDPSSQKLGDGWIGKFCFTLKPKSPNSVKAVLENTFRIDPPSPFMSFMRIFRWPKDQERVVAIRGQELLFFGSDSSSHQEKKQSTFIELENLEEVIMKYFPSVDHKELKKAMPSIVRNMKLASEKEKLSS
ncbi:uncharacterized protein LOC124164518 [Ischnura elegans]|uniref:uncharacterized protein LOC124164518 n=1 Tax=Ischnura elegans TaxID=197161 RepID=UPI001ED87939|nr:uncharacterized protein LOC124164518 [Ischnura elegans]XP_046397836.1 uncharacterized protein LOC124164518 [Ischnura elegans]